VNRFQQLFERVKKAPPWTWLLLYITLILITPVVFNLVPVLRDVFRWYMRPLGSLQSVFVSVLGASIGSFIAIMGAVWISNRNKKVQEQTDIGKNALIIYYDFLFAFQDLLPFLNEIMKDEKTYFSFSQEDYKNLLNDNGIQLHLTDDWIKIVAFIKNSNSKDNLVASAYRIYGILRDIQGISDGRITNRNTIIKTMMDLLKCVNRTPGTTAFNFAILSELAKLSGINDIYPTCFNPRGTIYVIHSIPHCDFLCLGKNEVVKIIDEFYS